MCIRVSYVPYVVKTQLHLLVVYWVSTTIGTTTCFGH